MASFQTLPGFREFYPEELSRRNHIFRLWRQTAHAFGFAEYDAPVLEPLVSPVVELLEVELLDVDDSPVVEVESEVPLVELESPVPESDSSESSVPFESLPELQPE